MAKKWSGFLPQNEEIREKWSEVLESPAEEQPVVEVKLTVTDDSEEDLENASPEIAEPIPIYQKE